MGNCFSIDHTAEDHNRNTALTQSVINRILERGGEGGGGGGRLQHASPNPRP